MAQGGLIDTVVSIARRAAGLQPPRRVSIQFGPDPDTTPTTGPATTGGSNANRNRSILGIEPWEASRKQRYSDYREMLEELPEASRSSEVINDFVFGNEDDAVRVEEDPNDLEETNLVSFRVKVSPAAAEAVERVCKDIEASLDLQRKIRPFAHEARWLGDSFYELLFGDDPVRLVGWRHLAPENVKILVDGNDQVRGYEVAESDGSTRFLNVFQMIHYAHTPLAGAHYGRSMFYSARGLRRQHEAINDTCTVLTLRKAAGDTYFLWPMPTNMTTQQEKDWIRRAQTSVDNDVFFEPAGGTLRRRIATLLETVPKIMPYRAIKDVQTAPTAVEMRPVNITQLIEFLKHLQDRLFVATGVPKALVGLERDVNARSTLEQQGMHFMLTVRDRSRDIATIIGDIMIRGLLVARVPFKPGDFAIVMPKPSVFDQQLRALVFGTRAGGVQALGQAGVPPKFALRLAFGLNDKQLEQFDILYDENAQKQATPEQITNAKKALEDVMRDVKPVAIGVTEQRIVAAKRAFNTALEELTKL